MNITALRLRPLRETVHNGNFKAKLVGLPEAQYSEETIYRQRSETLQPLGGDLVVLIQIVTAAARPSISSPVGTGAMGVCCACSNSRSLYISQHHNAATTSMRGELGMA